MGSDSRQAAAARHAYLRKLDSHLQNLAAARLEGADLRADGQARDADVEPADRRVLVDVRVLGPIADARSALRAQGMDVVRRQL